MDDIMTRIEKGLEAERAKPVKQKWCNCCGRRVDLRKKGAAEIRRESCLASGIKNREYHFVCSKECYQKMWGGI
jgi:hypothetical protein